MEKQITDDHIALLKQTIDHMLQRYVMRGEIPPVNFVKNYHTKAIWLLIQLKKELKIEQDAEAIATIESAYGALRHWQRKIKFFVKNGRM